MKKFTLPLLMILVLLPCLLLSQQTPKDDDANGDWAAQYVTLYNTSEADMMVRAGDIDNLGFGWPANFDPFSGNNTPSHGYPWAVDTTDAMGTDRIMVISSYNYGGPVRDGYTSGTSRPENLPRPIVLEYDLDGMDLTSAALQFFADDFQAPVWGCTYFVNINGVDAPYIADLINSLHQTGPIGKIVNVIIPQEHLYLLESDSLAIFFDDTTSGKSEGYAVDFVKLLLNPKGFTYTAKVYGNVTNPDEFITVFEAIVSATASNQTLTDEDGYYLLTDIPAGITNMTATKFGHDTASALVDLKVGDSVRVDFQLHEVLDAEFEADQTLGTSLPFTVQFTDLTSLWPDYWLWDFGDGATSEEQNPSHTYTSSGVFTVSLFASDEGSENTETKVGYIQILIAGVEENDQLSNLIIGPNPVSGNIFLSYTLEENCNLRVEMFDLTGKQVKLLFNQDQQRGDYQQSYEMDGLSDGIYFLRFSAGASQLTQKIVIAN